MKTIETRLSYCHIILECGGKAEVRGGKAENAMACCHALYRKTRKIRSNTLTRLEGKI